MAGGKGIGGIIVIGGSFAMLLRLCDRTADVAKTARFGSKIEDARWAAKTGSRADDVYDAGRYGNTNFGNALEVLDYSKTIAEYITRDDYDDLSQSEKMDLLGQIQGNQMVRVITFMQCKGIIASEQIIAMYSDQIKAIIKREIPIGKETETAELADQFKLFKNWTTRLSSGFKDHPELCATYIEAALDSNYTNSFEDHLKTAGKQLLPAELLDQLKYSDIYALFTGINLSLEQARTLSIVTGYSIRPTTFRYMNYYFVKKTGEGLMTLSTIFHKDFLNKETIMAYPFKPNCKVIVSGFSPEELQELFSLPDEQLIDISVFLSSTLFR